MTDTTAGEGVLSFEYGGCRVQDIAYTAFMMARQPNGEDGEATDWFNDTWPAIKALIAAQPSAGAQGEAVAWLTPGGDVTRSHAYAVEQSANDPTHYPKALGFIGASDIDCISLLADLDAGKPVGREAAATIRSLIADLATPSQPDTGYMDAFYQLAEMMGLPASPQSPRTVWETVMRPRLQKLLDKPDTGDVAKLHPATSDLIDRFAAALKIKLAKAEVKYGYSDGWLNVGWQADLASKLAEHVQKGDPRDVAAYCAFAWHHGWLTTPSDTGDVEALREDGPFVAGLVWQETDITDEDGNIIWTSEVQTAGGWSVIATVHGATEDEAKQRRDACLAALSKPNAPGRE